MSGYLGSGQAFDAAITEFAGKYADQNERDYAAFSEAISARQVEAHSG